MWLKAVFLLSVNIKHLEITEFTIRSSSKIPEFCSYKLIVVTQNYLKTTPKQQSNLQYIQICILTIQFPLRKQFSHNFDQLTLGFFFIILENSPFILWLT